MSYYVAYRTDTRQPIGIYPDGEQPDFAGDPLFDLKWFRGEVPPLSKYRWDDTDLAYVPRDEVAITQLAFRNRFLPAEKTAIYTAAETNIEVRIWLDDLAATTSVRLNNAQTIASVQALEAAGLIGEGRADEILNTPAAAHELAE